MSNSVILRDFSFSRDFRRIRWRATIWFNILRAMCAGILPTCLMLFAIFQGPPAQNQVPWIDIAIMPLFWPFGSFFALFPFTLLLRAVAAVFPDGFGVFILIPVFFITVLAVSLGDPIVCLLHKVLPIIVPVDDPPLFSTQFVFWILDAPEVSIAS